MMSTQPTRPSSESASPLDGQDPVALASYNQNFETFRALNSLMWQIPLIAMTLTGGLWFGVSRVDGMPGLRAGLLALACAGDVGLIIVLERLRHIIGEYLSWLRAANSRGFVSAAGDHWYNKPTVVKRSFQAMLGFAALISFMLFVAAMVPLLSSTKTQDPRALAIAWYDAHATTLADGYEGLAARDTHPQLFKMLIGAPPLRILDVGAGSGRDAAAFADLGHDVTAIEPSAKMLRVARALHANSNVAWVADSLPELAREKGPYDLIVLSAVWMHVPPADRPAAFDRLTSLLAPNGRIYLTLRLGAAETDRGIWSVDPQEVQELAAAHRLKVDDLGRRPDLMGRDHVQWDTLLMSSQLR